MAPWSSGGGNTHVDAVARPHDRLDILGVVLHHEVARQLERLARERVLGAASLAGDAPYLVDHNAVGCPRRPLAAVDCDGFACVRFMGERFHESWRVSQSFLCWNLSRNLAGSRGAEESRGRGARGARSVEPAANWKRACECDRSSIGLQVRRV